uniref:Venom Kazal domain peptide 1 n=1 Tax=Pristhesancus plagipennis TaxID=1955184 RepID=A0A2K8JM10_PRIPG|nr:venom Kazal domain peptide 1 [Pristhesancus plagipennis]
MKNFYCLLFFVLLIVGLEAASTKKKCQCDCKKYPTATVCAKDLKTGDTETFLNVCQVTCYNCTHNKNYVIMYSGECKN